MADRLEQILRDADLACPTLPGIDGFAATIRRIEARRRVVRRGLAAAAVVVVIVTLLIPRHARVAPLAASVDPARLAALSLEADLHALTAEKLASAQTLKHVVPPIHSDPQSDLQFQRDRAALILVYDADHDVEQKRPTEAVAAYRRAIELFPQSHWADVARQRLKEIES